MENPSYILVALGVGLIVGSYVTSKVLAYRTRTKRHAMRQALDEISCHQWNTGKHNDAVVITRIALRGLAGELPVEEEEENG